MTIQVILTNVQKGTHLGPEAFRGVELETADLCHDHVCTHPGIDVIDKGLPDVSSHKDLQIRSPQHLSHQARGGGFSIRAGYRNNRLINISCRQFQLTNNRYSRLPCRLKRPYSMWNTRAHHDKVA